MNNKVMVSSATKDPEHDDNQDTATTTVTPPSGAADLEIALTDEPDPVDAAARLTYTIAGTNQGPEEAIAVTVTDTLPGAVSFVSASGSGWSCTAQDRQVRCDRG